MGNVFYYLTQTYIRSVHTVSESQECRHCSFLGSTSSSSSQRDDGVFNLTTAAAGPSNIQIPSPHGQRRQRRTQDRTGLIYLFEGGRGWGRWWCGREMLIADLLIKYLGLLFRWCWLLCCCQSLAAAASFHVCRLRWLDGALIEFVYNNKKFTENDQVWKIITREAVATSKSCFR